MWKWGIDHGLKIKKRAIKMNEEELKALIEREMARCGRVSSGLSNEEKSRNSEMLHKLWTAALASPDYDKSAWLNIEKQLRSADLVS